MCVLGHSVKLSQFESSEAGVDCQAILLATLAHHRQLPRGERNRSARDARGVRELPAERARMRLVLRGAGRGEVRKHVWRHMKRHGEGRVRFVSVSVFSYSPLFVFSSPCFRILSSFLYSPRCVCVKTLDRGGWGYIYIHTHTEGPIRCERKKGKGRGRIKWYTVSTQKPYLHGPRVKKVALTPEGR